MATPVHLHPHQETPPSNDEAPVGKLTRRSVLLSLAGTALASACTSGGKPEKSACRTVPTANGGAAGYCLVDPLLVRTKSARLLAVGEAVLAKVDDNTAVIVARDATGFHALSAICTHACCVVSLCRDPLCATTAITPDDCGETAATAVPAPGIALLCICHGSNFNLADGAVLSGPAKKPLPAYAIAFDGDDVLVDTSTLVSAALRVPM